MPGRQRIRNPLAKLADPKHVRPRRRCDVRSLSRKEQQECERLATMCSGMLQYIDPTTYTIPDDVLQGASKQYGIPPYEILQHVVHFILYTNAHPGDAPAAAFAPLPQATQPPKTPAVSSNDVPRRHPHISTIKDMDQRDAIMTRTRRIAQLLDLRDRHYGVLPEGELDQAAADLHVTRNWVEKQMDHLRQYRAAYSHEQEYTDYNAFTPLPKGRPKGRKNSETEVQEIIEQAALNKRWPSFSGDGSVDQARQSIGPKLIHSLVEREHPGAQSESTTWRMFNDFRRNHPALFTTARGSVEHLQKIFPWINNKVAGVCERLQVDIRPLPVVVDIGNGIRATVHALLIVDDFSDFKPAWHALPAKRLDTDEEVYTQDYTARKCRELAAIAQLRMGKRSRIIYADNGSTFLWDALLSYMSFLVSPGEDPTLLIHRRSKRPRGGGNIENELGFVTQFLQFRPSYILESDYRRSYAEGRTVEVPSMEQFLVDFDAFMNYNNQERVDGKPSCLDRFTAGPDYGLTLPAIENLAMFASGERIEMRRPNPGGFKLDRQFYVPYRQDPELALALADAVEKAQKDKTLKVPLRICTLEEFTFIFFSLDNERTWELAIDKERGDPSWQDQVERMKNAEAWVMQKGNEAAQFFQVLLSAREDPIVLNGLRRRHRFEELAQAQSDLEALKQSPDYQMTPRHLSAILAAPTGDMSASAPTTQPTGQKTTKKSKQSKTKAQASTTPKASSERQAPSEPPMSSVPPPTPQPEVPTDNDDFVRQLNQRLGLR